MEDMLFSPKFIRYTKIFFTLLLIVGFIVLIFLAFKAPEKLSNAEIYSFSARWISLILEGLPFLLVGAAISALLAISLPDNFFKLFLSRHKRIGLLVAAFAGIIFPMCECGIVPIAARCIKKGVPPPFAITFMLAAPIISPIVIASTWIAFSDNLWYLFFRIFIGVLVALLVGASLLMMRKKNWFNVSQEEHTHKDSSSKFSRFTKHTVDDFLSIGKYFIIGTAIASAFQTYVPRVFFDNIGTNVYLSVIFMMALAFVLSVCAEADAFIARTFALSFTPGSIIGFMVYGPMIDIKNTLMLLHAFKIKEVILLIGFVTLYVLLFSLGVNFIWNILQ